MRSRSERNWRVRRGQHLGYGGVPLSYQVRQLFAQVDIPFVARNLDWVDTFRSQFLNRLRKSSNCLIEALRHFRLNRSAVLLCDCSAERRCGCNLGFHPLSDGLRLGLKWFACVFDFLRFDARF